MAQGYLTLEEAAQKLVMSPDELKAMARKGEIRSFQDRGSWRFRLQDVEDVNRRRGMGSDPDLVLGEALKPIPVSEAEPPDAVAKTRAAEVFDFSTADEDAVGIGAEPLGTSDSPSSKKHKSDSKLGARTPPPFPGSDSDVKLVGDSSDHDIPSAGDARLATPESPPPRKKTSSLKMTATGDDLQATRPSKLVMKKSSKLDMDQATVIDSGVRLVPMEGDSDVRIVDDGTEHDITLGSQPPRSSTDSDVRLEQVPEHSGKKDESHITEEIDLGELGLDLPPGKKGKSDQALAKTSPFELPDSDFDLPTADSSSLDRKHDSSGDFELTPAGDDPLPLEADSKDSSNDFVLELPDDSDEVSLGELPTSTKKRKSGIGVDKPADSGISLEQGGEGSDEIEFELTLETGTTPKPVKAAGTDDSDSEFELTLDSDASPGESSSDSEFELTLDDSGGLAPLGDSDSGDKDIFETDFEVPALDEESGSEAMAVDEGETDLDSSDFELGLGDEAAVEDDSASDVVALDEDALDEETSKKKGKKKKKGAATEAEEFDDLADDDLETAGSSRTVVQEKLVANAPWGALPVAIMLPCVVVMFLVGFMGFELVQSQNGYRPPGVLTRTVGDMLGMKMKN